MHKENAFTGIPFTFSDICMIYPPTNQDIITTGYEKFTTFVNILTVTKEDISDDFYKDEKNKGIIAPTPLEFLFINYNNPDAEKAMQFKTSVENAFYFFTREKIKMVSLVKTILIGEISQGKYITEENYFSFQNLIRESLGRTPLTPPDPNEDPRMERFRAKQRERDRVKAKQQSKNGIDYVSTLSALCLIGAGITPFNLKDLTYAASNMLIRTYQNKDKYETDVRSLQAGADSKKVKPKYWIKNLDED